MGMFARWQTLTFGLSLAAACACTSTPLMAQTCTPGFADGFEFPGVQGTIRASIMYDAQDGNGPRLYVAGQFSRAGGKLCNGIAMFDGTNFQPLGGGVPNGSLPNSGSGIVNALEVLDPDGAGPLKPELWVGGSFTRARQPGGTLLTVNGLARWNGSTQTWATVSLPGTTQILALLADDQTTGPNTGPRIYVTTRIPTGTSRYITGYRWNGSAYAQLTIGPAPMVPVLNNVVVSLAKYNGRVYLGGASTEGLRRMSADGATHELLPSGSELLQPTYIQKMAVFQGRLWIAGSFMQPVLQSFDGVSWQNETLGGAASSLTLSFLDGNPIGDMRVIDLGTGPKLYLGSALLSSNIPTSNPTAFGNAAVWDGTTLVKLGNGFITDTIETFGLQTFCGTTLRGQPVVFVGGGGFPQASALNNNGTTVPGATAFFYDGADWLPQYPAPVAGGYNNVQVVTFDGLGERLYASNARSAVARWLIPVNSGSGWQNSTIPAPVIDGNNFGLIRYDDGAGEALFGYSSSSGGLYKYNGTAWTQLLASPFADGGITNSTVIFDTDGSGPERPWLIFGGNFQVGATGSAEQLSIQAWDGTAWRTLGSGLPDGMSGGNFAETAQVFSLTTFDDGSGMKLYAAGAFIINGQVWQVARYDGTGSTGTWTGIGRDPGTVSFPTALSSRVVDLGSGPKLYVGGRFNDLDNGTTGNPSPIAMVARWDPPNWTSVGITSSALGVGVNSIIGFDDGSGTKLYICGTFQTLNGAPFGGFGRYDGTSWSPIGTGLNSFQDNLLMNPTSMLVFDDDGAGPTRPALYISGMFDNANGKYTQNLARYGCPPVSCVSDFNRDGTTNVADIFSFLSAWFAGCTGTPQCAGLTADVNSDGIVNVSDIFNFLSRWFAGC